MELCKCISSPSLALAFSPSSPTFLGRSAGERWNREESASAVSLSMLEPFFLLQIGMERYEVLRDIGSGNFGVAKLVRDVRTKELFAVKLIERGQKVSSFCFPLLCCSFSKKKIDAIPRVGWIRDSLVVLFSSESEVCRRQLVPVFSILSDFVSILAPISNFAVDFGASCPHAGLAFRFLLQIDEHVQREIMNHRSLKHPNIVRFKEV